MQTYYIISIIPHSPLVAVCPRELRATGFFLYCIGKLMARISAFIDGFNLYHAIANNTNYRHYKWLNLRKLINLYMRKQDVLVDVFYFTSLATWNPDKAQRHELYIKAQTFFGVKPIYGNFKKVTKQCNADCRKCYKTYEEKETDVNIAVQLYEQAVKNTYDTAIILSGDSDQVPAIKAIKNSFPTKKVNILIPPGRDTNLLKQTADQYFKITHKQLSTSLLPDIITLADGTQISCPMKWKIKT